MQRISLICFITAAVDEFNYKASRPFLAPLLKCWENSEQCRGDGWWAVTESPPEGTEGRGGGLSHNGSLCLAGGRLPLLPSLTPQGRGAERGGRRQRPMVQRRCHFPGHHRIWCSQCPRKDEWQPPAPSSCLLCAPCSSLAFNYSE